MSREPHAFQQDRQRLFDSGQARQAVGSPTSGTARQRLRQAKRQTLGLSTMTRWMGSQRQFSAPTKRQGPRSRPQPVCPRFDSTPRLTETKEMSMHAIARLGGRSHDHVIGQSQFGKIGTSTEGRWLTGTDDHTLHVAFPQPPG